MSYCLQNLDINRYYRIYENVHRMMCDREFSPLEPKLEKSKYISLFIGLLAQVLDPDDPMDEFGLIDELIILFEKQNKLLMVYFHPFDSKLAQKDITGIYNILNEKGAQQLVIIANASTPKVSNVLSILGNGGQQSIGESESIYNVQIFTENEMIYNVTDHQLVPKHIKASPEEKEHILDKYTKSEDGKLHPEWLPGIYTTDAIVRYYNFEIDDLIRIERPRKDGEIDITYRIVTVPMADEKDKRK